MRIKSFFIFLIIGSTIAFAGLPLKVTTQVSADPLEQNQVKQSLENVIVLVYLLSMLGIATFIIIRVLEIVTKLDLMKDLMMSFNKNPRTYYAY